MIVRKFGLRQSMNISIDSSPSPKHTNISAVGRQLLALSRRTPTSGRLFSSEAGTPVETAVQTPPKETIKHETVPQPDNPLHEVVQASSSKAPTAEAETWGKLEKQSEQQPAQQH